MNNYPLIRFVIIFIVGIIAQSILHLPISIIIILFTLLLGFTISLLIIKKEKLEFVKSILLYSSILLFGTVYLGLFNQTEVRYPFPEPKYSNAKIDGTINRLELKRDGRINLYLISSSVKIKEKIYVEKYNLLCSIYDDNKKTEKLFNGFSVGNKISIKGTVQQPRSERNPGEFDYEKYLNSKGIVAIVNVYNTDSVKSISKEMSVVKNLIFQIRKTVDEQISILHNKTTSALLRGLILADRSLIDYQVNDYFINAGVVHVLSVSGLHVGYIVLIFLVLFNRFNIYTRYLLTFVGLLFYLIITGADAPVFRSTLMALVLLAAPLTGRDYNSLNSLSFSALIILLISPNELFNPSFQLSFSAILSLIIIYPPLKKFIDNLHIKPKALNWIVIFCMTSIAAQLGTLPFTLTYFHRLSVSALLANFVVIPVSGAIVALGILSIVIGSVSHWIGSVFASANELMTYFTYWFVQLLGKKEYSYITINQFSVYDAVIFYLILTQIFYILKKFVTSSAKIIAVFASITLMVLLMRFDNYDLMPKNTLSVMAIDVGQGDAFLIKFPNMKTALIDAGDRTEYFDNGSRVILPLLDKLEIDTLDYAFISHVDSDHYRGMEAIVKEHRIKMIYKPKIDSSSASDLEFEKLLRTQNYKPYYYSKKIISIGNSRIYVLNDTINNYFESQNSNDRSGMFKLVAGRTSFLLTGDASVTAEANYLNTYKSFLRSNVLKIGHHGSKSSSSDEFIKNVKPEIAIISAGIANKFRHPSKVVLEKLTANDIRIYRTDKNGALLFQSDGRSITPINWKQMKAGFNY
ncbi:MAG: DNA internalization-related competence protein ComEC/Rec2 [Ignavibacteriales bacterium]|nr:DNA internalization-related competence protein ComEC/Rec2 [Ignavibacteriales bacterium]